MRPDLWEPHSHSFTSANNLSPASESCFLLSSLFFSETHWFFAGSNAHSLGRVFLQFLTRNLWSVDHCSNPFYFTRLVSFSRHVMQHFRFRNSATNYLPLDNPSDATCWWLIRDLQANAIFNILVLSVLIYPKDLWVSCAREIFFSWVVHQFLHCL